MLMNFVLFLLRIFANTFASSTKCEMHKFNEGSSFSIYEQYFYSQEMESLYQCMEICSYYPLCKSLSFEGKTCKLRRMIKEDEYAFEVGLGVYLPAISIPKNISGACADNDCSNGTYCASLQSGNYICIPHNFPTFSCPSQWTYSSTKCYYFHLKLLTWQETKEFCSTLDSNITEIRSQEEQHYLYTMLRFLQRVPRGLQYYKGDEKFFWTSLVYQQNNGNWVWNVSGRILNDNSFTSWSPDYTALLSTGHLNCMGISNVTFYKWTVADCRSSNFVICEKLIVTCDDTWICHYDPESEQESMKRKNAHTPKTKKGPGWCREI